MAKDGLVFLDSEERVIFNYYSFCEVLKGCITHYFKVSSKEANDCVVNSQLLKSPISNVNDVYFFSHEHPYHWAMVCYLGSSYYENNPDLVRIPESYDDWERDFTRSNGLKEELFIFS